MARITVEDCLEKIQNHFDLVLLASKRARDLSRVEQPAQALLDRNNDKPAVIALREIAAGLVDMSYLEEKPDMEEEEENILAKFQGMQPMKPVDRAYHFDEEDDDVEEAARVEEPAEPVREAEIAVAKTDKASADAAEGTVAVAKTDKASADAAVAVAETDEASADAARARSPWRNGRSVRRSPWRKRTKRPPMPPIARRRGGNGRSVRRCHRCRGRRGGNGRSVRRCRRGRGRHATSLGAPERLGPSGRGRSPIGARGCGPIGGVPIPIGEIPIPIGKVSGLTGRTLSRCAPLSTGARKETEKRQRP